jgi:RimJ/RimL family protein N-acetyltransferase
VRVIIASEMPPLPKSLTLHHDEIVLRDWREDDAPALEPVCGDVDVCRFSSVPWTYSLQEARWWIRRIQRARSTGTGLALAITRAGQNQALGNVNLVRFSEDGRQAALGYWLVPAAREQGLAVTAARMLSSWGFEQMALARIELAILPDNTASHHVALRLGATREGVRPDSHEAAGRTWDMVIYALHGPPLPAQRSAALS